MNHYKITMKQQTPGMSNATYEFMGYLFAVDFGHIVFRCLDAVDNDISQDLTLPLNAVKSIELV